MSINKKVISFWKSFACALIAVCMLLNLIPGIGALPVRAEETDPIEENEWEDPLQITVGPWDEWEDMNVEVVDPESEEARAMLANMSMVQMFSLGDGFSGWLGDQMVGFEQELYQALDEITLTSNTVRIDYVLQEGETAEEMFDLFKASALKIALAYTYDHPERVLWFERVQYGWGGNASGIILQMSFPAEYYYSEELGAVALQVASGIVSSLQGTTRYDILRELHDYLVSTGEYDEEALSLQRGDEHFFYAHSALGILLHNTGVCESYAKSFKILCNMVGIPCYIVTSETHAWNYVLMPNGEWYMIDCTFDDPIYVGGWTGEKPIHYEYFLVSNDPPVDNRDHVPEGIFDIPMTAVRAYDPEVDEVLDPEILIEGCSLTLNGTIGLNFYLDVDERLVDEENYVTLSQNGTVLELWPLEEALLTGTRYKVTCQVAAKEIYDEITLCLYDGENNLLPLTKDDVIYEEGYTYSVNDYIDRALQSDETSDELKALARDLRVYGTYAAQYFEYGEEIVTEEITNVTASDLSSYRMTSTGSVDGIYYYGSSLLLKNMTSLRHYFLVDGEADLTAYTFLLNGEEVEAVRSGNLYYVEAADIAAQDLEEMPELVVSMAEAEGGYHLTYGPLSYARQTLTSNRQSDLHGLMKALYLYWQSSENYFHSLQ